MEWIVVDIKIAVVLLAWILACYGYGGACLKIYKNITKQHIFSDYVALEFLVSLVLGVAFLSFLVQIVNFFIPIFHWISIALLLVGIGAFIYLYRANLTDCRIYASGAFSFIIVAILSFFNDSISDSINYHIQIVSWIQASPVIFGLGNVHGRLGFNGIIYNFYALTDVSQIFPHLRSFIGNEIVFFGVFFSAFLVILKREWTKIVYVFLFCSLLPFMFILHWAEFQALYCEGIGAVLGILLFSLALLVLDSSYKPKATLLLLMWCIALFATIVKIANAGLVVAVIICFIVIFKSHIFSKQYLKYYILLGLGSFVFVLPWVLKGYMTSGMIAYPASIGYIESLPFAVSEAQRANEVCWIMSWARAPGENCTEVLASYSWAKDWFMMKTRYFGWYFKYFVYALFACLALFVALKLMPKRLKDSIICYDKNICIVFVCILCGLLFWFFSGPDPRFGMVYIVPLLGILYCYNQLLIQTINNKILQYIFIVAFICSVVPLFFNGRYLFLLTWTLCIIAGFVRFRESRILFGIIIILSIISIPNLYRKSFAKIKQIPKVSSIFVEEKKTNFDTTIYLRTDSPTPHSKEVFYEPLPTTPYWNPQIKEMMIFGRKAYINADKHKEQ